MSCTTARLERTAADPPNFSVAATPAIPSELRCKTADRYANDPMKKIRVDRREFTRSNLSLSIWQLSPAGVVPLSVGGC
jgi:hypothetical protein